MPIITFFRQQRRDGGIRTGVEVDADTVLSRFQAGRKDRDPTLVWYVDVRVEGAGLPSSPEAAREWLTRQGATVRDVLTSLAEDLPAGVDPGERPFERLVTINGAGRRKAKLAVAVAAVRRAEAVRLPAVLRDIALHWDAYISDLVVA